MALGIDLGAVREQRGAALGEVVADVDERRELVLAVRVEAPLEPGRVRALLTPVEVRLVQRLHPRDRPRHVVQLERLPRLARVGIRLGITGEIERRNRDLVHTDVIGVRVEVAVVAVGDDHLRTLPRG